MMRPALLRSCQLAPDRVGSLDALVEQRVRHTFGETPLCKQLRRLLERAGFPPGVDDVGIEVVFGRAAARIVEVPEVARRDRMAPGPERRTPAAPRHIEPAAEQLVD